MLTSLYTRTFFRAHALGNDYLVWEGDPAEVDDGWVRRVCDRHTGVGSDGILVPMPRTVAADVGLRIFNPDGSEAEKSGNGVRIFALWHARQTGLMDMVVDTPGGLVVAHVSQQNGADHVAAEMGRARVAPAEVIAGLETFPVDIGNPHRVVLSVPDDWEALGARIEGSVPGRTNVQFVRVIDRGRVEVFIWERGAGRTRASGSSASAVARIVSLRGLCDTRLIVTMEGGNLHVDVGPDGHVQIAGRVIAVGRFDLDPLW